MKTWSEIKGVSFTLDLHPFVDLTPTNFEEVCRRNPDLNLELAPGGRLVIMPPAGSESGGRNSYLNYQLTGWTLKHGGHPFDSSAGFTLPNNAVRSPDASWVASERWGALTPEQRRTFAPLCPDFVAELVSPSDSLPELRAKMAEYIQCGARLAWLINPEDQSVEIYRPGREVERLERPRTLSGEDVLPGLVVELDRIL